jgi:hypothetical protein
MDFVFNLFWSSENGLILAIGAMVRVVSQRCANSQLKCAFKTTANEWKNSHCRVMDIYF